MICTLTKAKVTKLCILDCYLICMFFDYVMVLGLAAEACIITVCVKRCISFFQLSQTYEALTHSFAGNDMRVLTLAKNKESDWPFKKESD